MVSKLIVVDVQMGKRVVPAPGQELPKGYFQRFGVTAETDREAFQLIEAYVAQDMDGVIIDFEDQGEPDLDGADSDIRSVVSDRGKKGFWYRSGRAFYLKRG
jgi:hypothetical protein